MNISTTSIIGIAVSPLVEFDTKLKINKFHKQLKGCARWHSRCLPHANLSYTVYILTWTWKISKAVVYSCEVDTAVINPFKNLTTAFATWTRMLKSPTLMARKIHTYFRIVKWMVNKTLKKVCSKGLSLSLESLHVDFIHENHTIANCLDFRL